MHLYSQRVEDIGVGGGGGIVWHRVPAAPGPGLVRMREALEQRDRMTELQRKARQRALACFGQTRMLSEHVAAYERAMGPAEF